jgi:two-component system, OmpR family, response regulator BaeR
MSDRILIAEDEPKLAEVLRDYLQQAGFSCHWISQGNEVVDWLRQHEVDLVLLDLMLPGRDGLDICKEIRGFSQLPIIMVTARVEEIDRLLGLELGADDYICKPYSPREVVARVKAVLRRAGSHEDPAADGLMLDEAGYRASLKGADLQLTAIEFTLLAFLADHPGRIFSRSQLMDSIYPDRRVVTDRTIDSHIKKLRKKIAAVSPEEELIRSVYGVGYKFERN